MKEYRIGLASLVLAALLCCAIINGASAFLVRGAGTPVSTVAPTITGVTVAGGTTVSYTSGIASGAQIGQIAVQVTGGTFSGTISQPGGTSGTSFATTGTYPSSYLVANSSTPTCTTTTNYSITITPTQAGYTNSGTAYSITVTCNPTSTTPSVVAMSPESASTGSGGTTSTVSIASLTSGDTLVVADYACPAQNTNCFPGGTKPNFTGVTASNGGVGSCALIPGSRSAPTDQAGTEQWRCAITASGSSITLTGTWASTCYFCHFVALDVRNLAASPDAGIANTAYVTTATNNMTVATNGGTGANTDFILSSMFGHNCCTGGTSITPDSNETAVINDNTIEWIVQYKVVSTGASNFTSSATTSSTTPYNGNISGYLPTGGTVAQTIALAANPTTGSCQNGATNTCMTVTATMTPASPPFNGTGGDGGTYSLVSAATGGTACNTGTIDTTNFSIGSTSGVVAISNTSVAAASYNVCVGATTSSGNVTNTPKYAEFPITVTAPVSQTIALGPSSGTCSTGATNTCATMVATMTPASPPFNGTGGDGGTYTMVASGGSCASIDASYATDFSLGSTSGVLAIANTSIAIGSYNVCVQAATTTGTVTNTPQYQQVAVTVTAAGTAVEVGSGVTLVNNGNTASNVPVQFGFGFARGDMPLGNTIICKDEGGTGYPCQIDELATRTALPHTSGETAGWQHGVVSLIYTPSWTAGASHTFHVYRQSGTYSGGTGLALSALTGAHDYQIHYQNVKDFNLNVIGSGNFTCDLNNAIAAGTPRAGVGGGVSGGGGGYDKIEDGGNVTVIDALAPAIDDSSHAPQGQIMCEFYAMLWQTGYNSGSLGNVQLMGWIGQPWQNCSTSPCSSTIGFNWGDVTLTDATTSTTLRNFSVQSNYAPSDFHPDPASGWPTDGFSSHLYAAQCYNSCNGGAFGSMTATGTSVSSQNGAFFQTSNIGGNNYLYVGSGNTGCTQGAYQIMSVSSGVATVSSAPCGAGPVTFNNWQMQSGFINNNGNLQSGAIIQFSATGGGTLPTGILATRPYFVAETVNSNGGTSDTPGPFAIHNVSTLNQWPDDNGFAGQGSCPSGSCIVVTRKVGLNPWAGTWLPADDSGHPFWVGSMANGAVLYPTLSNTQKLYLESTGVIPSYYVNGPAATLTANPFYLQQNYGAGGPYYQSMSAGPQETNIDGGGTHESIGVMGNLEANAFMNMTQTNWDMVHTHALTQAHAFAHSVLNKSTGYYTPYDCGPYPNGNTASCGTYGSPIGSAGGYIQNYIVWVNPSNSNDYGGFTQPAAVTGLSTASINQFDSGIFWADGADGSNAACSHDPDYGNDLAFIVGGEPWYLRGVQNLATWAMLCQYPTGTNNVNGSQWTSGGYTYTGWVMSGNTDAPRGPAWTMRNFIYGAILGSDNDPGRKLFWNYYIENIDGWYHMIHQYVGQNSDNCTGCTADPNFETMGGVELNHSWIPSFMASYTGVVQNFGYGATHYVSDTLSGSSAQWAAQQATRFAINRWYGMPNTTGAVGNYAVSSYWSSNEEYVTNTGWTNLYNCTWNLPGCIAMSPNAGGIWVLGGDAGFLPTYNDPSGVLWYEGAAYSSTTQGLLANGDAMVPACNDDCSVLSYFKTPPYYAVNVTRNVTDPHNGNQSTSFQLTTTSPSTQACTNPTGNTGCPAASVPSEPNYTRNNFAWRPSGTQPTSAGTAGAGFTAGYVAEDWAMLQLNANNGAGTANLSGAVTNLTARYNLPALNLQSYFPIVSPGDVNWQSWYMGPVTITSPPPPAQTIANITANPSTGSCATGVTSNCTTVSATMNPTTPNFAVDGGTFQLVSAASSGGACTGTIDSTDFTINSSTGVVSISNTSVAVQNYTICVKAATTASQVTNSPQYQTVPIMVTAAPPSQTISAITANPSTGSCATGTAGVTCTTVSAAMSPSSPNFAADGGTFSLVASGGSCSGGDTTDFAINATSGVITVSNPSVTVQSHTVCVGASTTVSNVTNSPQYQSISISVSVAGGGKTIKNHGVCNGSATGNSIHNETCNLTVSGTGDLVIGLWGNCGGASCNGGPIQQPTVTFAAGSGGGSSGSCTAITPATQTGTANVGTGMWECVNMPTSGTVAFSWSWSGTGADQPTTLWVDVSGASTTSPDLGIGNFFYTGSSPSTSSSVATNGNVSVSNAMVLGICMNNSGFNPSVTSPMTQIDLAGSSPKWVDAYQFSPTSGQTASLGCSWGISSQAVSISIDAFQ